MDFKVYDERNEVQHNIIKQYNYGSVVYGTSNKQSDKDYIVIVKSDENLLYSVRNEDADYTVYSETVFIKAIQEHKLSILECIFQNDMDEYLKYFKLDFEKLRREFSSVSSNSYVKCKKKIKDGEGYIGLKSLFHSIRILQYGIQIAVNGRIVDYKVANKYLDMIFDIGENWEVLHKTFKPIHNELKSTFKALAPLESEKENYNG